jgi:hypothetical protein
MRRFCEYCVSLDDQGECGLARSAIGGKQFELSTYPFDEHGGAFFVGALIVVRGGLNIGQ